MAQLHSITGSPGNHALLHSHPIALQDQPPFTIYPIMNHKVSEPAQSITL